MAWRKTWEDNGYIRERHRKDPPMTTLALGAGHKARQRDQLEGEGSRSKRSSRRYLSRLSTLSPPQMTDIPVHSEIGG